MSGWTDERVELLKKLWRDGLSASQIARQLGGVSRNAVIGKANRLRLSGRAAPSRPEQRSVKASRPSAPRALKLAGRGTVFEEPSDPRPPRIAVPVRDEAPGTATILTLANHMCKWPIGSPDAPDFTFCGERKVRGQYCDTHAELAYSPQSDKRRSSANELIRALRRYIA